MSTALGARGRDGHARRSGIATSNHPFHRFDRRSLLKTAGNKPFDVTNVPYRIPLHDFATGYLDIDHNGRVPSDLDGPSSDVGRQPPLVLDASGNPVPAVAQRLGVDGDHTHEWREARDVEKIVVLDLAVLLQGLVEGRWHSSRSADLDAAKRRMIVGGPRRIEHSSLFLAMPSLFFLRTDPAVAVVVPARAVDLRRQAMQARIHVGPIVGETGHVRAVAALLAFIIQLAGVEQKAVVVVLDEATLAERSPNRPDPFVEVIVFAVHLIVRLSHRRSDHVAGAPPPE